MNEPTTHHAPHLPIEPATPGRGFFDAPPKTAFTFGFISGIALMSIVGLLVLLPLARTGSGTSTTRVAGATTGTAPANTNSTGTANDGSLTKTVSPIRAVTKDDHIRGPENAPVTIVEYSDFQCPYCSRFHPTMQRLIQEYPKQIRWIYRDYPLTSLHPEAQPAAEAADCAAEQGKFWEYADALFANQQSLSSSYYPELAKTLKLNLSKFTTCVSNGSGKSRIASDVEDGTKNGVNGTPTSFINGRAVPGAYPYETMKAYVDQVLAGT